MSHYVKMFQRSVLVLLAVVLVVPVLAHAGDFEVFSVAPKGKVTLTVSADGVTAKAGSVTVPSKTSITLNWTVPSGWKGCWSSWNSQPLLTSGTITGTLPAEAKGRSFVLTCVGVGQAQTASVQVTVSKPNLTVTTPTVSSPPYKGMYPLSPAPFELIYVVKNPSKVDSKSPIGFSVQLFRRQGDGIPTAIMANDVTSLAAGKEKRFTFNDITRKASTNSYDKYSYRVCVDGDGTSKGDIDESNESDNCSAFTKGFHFGNQ